jgi:hypothetical protein
MAEIKIERRRSRTLPILLAALALVLGLLTLTSRRSGHTNVSAGSLDARQDTTAATGGHSGAAR